MQNKVIINSGVLDGLLNFSSTENVIGGFLYGIKVLTDKVNSVYISSIEPAITEAQMNQLTGNFNYKNAVSSLNKLIGIYLLKDTKLQVTSNLNDIVLYFDQLKLDLSCILIGPEEQPMDIVVDDSNNIISYKNYLKSRCFLNYQEIHTQRK